MQFKHVITDFVVAAFVVATQFGPATARADDLDAFLQSSVAGTRVAVVVGLLDDHGTQIFSAGTLDNGTDRAPDADTLFEIGSITKTFTVLLLDDMAARGQVGLDDPVSKYLPPSVSVPTRNGREITLLDLATHTSGLPRDPDNLTPTHGLPENAFADYTPARLYQFLRGYKLTRDPGERFEYSNVGMALLGHALALRAGTNYESLVVQGICRPLGLDSTRITLTPELKARLAIGHDQRGNRAPNWDFMVYDGAGGIRSTANDLLKYLAANLGLVKSDLTARMQETHVIRHRDTATHGDTAMAWMVRGEGLKSESALLGHAGGTGGYETFIGFDQAHRKGVVVLCSQQGGLSPETLGWLLLRGVPLGPEIARALQPPGTIAGVGVALAQDPATHAVRIAQVLSNSPAARAGLANGLIVQKIDDAPVAGRDLLECVGLIRGTAGTTVRLELVNLAHAETNIVQLTRQKTPVIN